MRDITYTESMLAGLRPEKEKAGLLPARPQEDGIGMTGEARRPADVWLPRGMQGDAEALDFAATSGLRSDNYRSVIDNPAIVFDQYELYKRAYKQTDQCCRDQGLRFSPLIVEAHGG
eukprot:3885644-Karenia_brevis.AAC.1